MSDDNAWKSFLSDSANSEATSPDSFDEELERLLDGLENVQLPPSVDGLRSTCRETSTTSTPTHFSSSDSAYSTDLTEDYSAMTYSSYSLDFDTIGDVNFVPEYNGVDPKDISVPLDISAFPDMSASFDSFGIPQFSAAFFQSQDVQIVKAQSDDGPYRPSIGISPDLLSSGTYYGPIPAIPTDAPVRVGSAIPSHTGPMRTKFVCPYCGHRKYSFFIQFHS